MEETLRYFINILHCDNEIVYHCRVINNDYKEVFNQILNEEEKIAFEKIMESNKEALLYRTHEKLRSLALIKIDEQAKRNIIDGTKFP